MRERDVGALGEDRVVLQERPEAREVVGVDVVDPEDRVRIADVRDGGRVQHRRLDRPDLKLDRARVAELFGEWDVGPAEFRHAHVDGDEVGAVRGPHEEEAGDGLDRGGAAAGLGHQEPADAAGGVAAGLDLAAVGVVDAHEGFGRGLAALDSDELVEADAGLPVGKSADHRGGGAHGGPPRVNDQKIVAEAVHLAERDHGHQGRSRCGAIWRKGAGR